MNGVNLKFYNKTDEIIPDVDLLVDIGYVSNNFKVIDRPFILINKKTRTRFQYVKCECVCGKKVIKNAYNIRDKKICSCGCLKWKSHVKYENLSNGITKKCNKCLENLPVSNFEKLKSSKDSLRRTCKHCRYIQDANRKYNIDFESKFDSQNLVCEICSCKLSRFVKTKKLDKIAIDHNHTTGAVRGLLCNRCNLSLGLLKDNTEILQNAINYLSKYSSD